MSDVISRRHFLYVFTASEEGVGLKQAFYLKYALNTSKKDRFRKRLMTAVCAGTVAFCAMCGGYLQNHAAAQNEYIKNVSERQIVVYNQTASKSFYMGFNEPIPPQNVEEIYQVENTETIVPVVRFVTIPQMTGGVCKYSKRLGYSEEEIVEELTLFFSYANRAGVSVKVPPEKVGMPDFQGGFDSNYSVWSYAIENYYDPRCDILDLTVKNGAYITRQFAEAVGITDEMLNGLTLTFEILVPVSSGQRASYIESYSDGSENEGYWIRENANYYEKAMVKVAVRGIFEDSGLDPYISSMRAAIFMPGDQMLEIVKEHLDPENKNFRQLTQNILEDTPLDYYNHFPVKPTIDTGYTVETWAPEAYYVVADDITVIDQVKEDLLKLNPNFAIFQEFQDYQAGVQFVNNSRGVLFYISYAVLGIVLLLMALIYVSLIDRRKFEFAILRANGMTKREVRKIICSEMLFQLIQIFIVGIIFAAAIYGIAGVWLGYPFQFDWMTILLLFLISLGAVFLPTVISLLFVNKFEPDQVMRN